MASHLPQKTEINHVPGTFCQGPFCQEKSMRRNCMEIISFLWPRKLSSIYFVFGKSVYLNPPFWAMEREIGVSESGRSTACLQQPPSNAADHMLWMQSLTNECNAICNVFNQNLLSAQCRLDAKNPFQSLWWKRVNLSSCCVHWRDSGTEDGGRGREWKMLARRSGGSHKQIIVGQVGAESSTLACWAHLLNDLTNLSNFFFFSTQPIMRIGHEFSAKIWEPK